MIGDLPAGDLGRHGQARAVGPEVDPGREAISRTAETLILNPPLPPRRSDGRGRRRRRSSGRCRRALGVVQDLRDRVPDPGRRPASEPAADRGRGTEALRQVAPGRAGAGDPEHPVRHSPTIPRGAPTLGAGLDHEGREKRPFLVARQVASQQSFPCKGGTLNASPASSARALAPGPVESASTHAVSGPRPGQEGDPRSVVLIVTAVSGTVHCVQGSPPPFDPQDIFLSTTAARAGGRSQGFDRRPVPMRPPLHDRGTVRAAAPPDDRAALAASATTTTFSCAGPDRLLARRPSGASCERSAGGTARAPWMRFAPRYRSPRFEMPSRRGLPPVVAWRRVRPSQPRDRGRVRSFAHPAPRPPAPLRRSRRCRGSSPGGARRRSLRPSGRTPSRTERCVRRTVATPPEMPP